MLFKLEFAFGIILVMLFFNLFFTNCIQSQTNKLSLKPSLKKQSNENLYNREETIELTKDFVGKQRAFDFTKELKLIYSRGMYGDSVFTIGYQIPYFKENGGIWYKTDIHSEEWTTVKKEIVELYGRIGRVVLSGECEPGTMSFSDFEFQSNKKTPYLHFYTASYKFLEEVTKLAGKISSIESSSEAIDMDAFNRFIEEKR